MTAVILAGGKGTRLRDYTQSIPKPLVKVKEKPVLEWQIETLRKNGITKIVLVIGHLGDKIKEYFRDGSPWGVNIAYFEEGKPLGTAGAFYDLKKVLPDEFLVLYGDLIFDVNVQRLIQFHHDHAADCTLMVHPNDHPADSDIVMLDDTDRVRGFLRKNVPRPFNYNNSVNAGIFYLHKQLFADLLKDTKQDLERDVIETALLRKKIFGYKTTEYLKDMGTPERYEQVLKHVTNGVVEKRSLSYPQKAVFLDRDGTINKQAGLIYKPEQLEISEEVYEAIGKLNRSEYLSIVITNQSVVARNLCSEQELKAIHRKMETLLGHRNVYIDDLYYCPHHPDAGYPEENRELKIECSCRKPKTGLIEAAVKKYNIDLASSYFIGDTSTDVQTGKNAQLKTILLSTADHKTDAAVSPDHYAKNLLEAITLITGRI